jgi:hypothetical protein
MSSHVSSQKPAADAVSGEHIVQLFDVPESRGDAVARFLSDGLAAGDHALVVARPTHVRAIADSLARLGVAIPDLVSHGRLTVLDAAVAMRAFMWNGLPDGERFGSSMGAEVRRLAAESPAGLRIYGEMVDILAEEGNFRGACALEQLWNQLAADATFTLLCGYASAHFAAPNAGSMLRTVCEHHGRVLQSGDDLLGNWLLGQQLAS